MRVRHSVEQIILGVGLAGLLLLTGCFDTREEFTINPDGSGKVVVECSFVGLEFFANRGISEEDLRSEVRQLMEKSRGVEIWRDISFKRLPDGRSYFRGTAYFKRLADLTIPGDFLRFAWQRDGSGRGTLELGGSGNRPPQSTVDKELTPEQQAEKIMEQRVKFQRAKHVVAAFVGELKQDVVFHLPGNVRETINFNRNRAGALQLRFEGAKALSVLEQRMMDDEWLRKHMAPSIDNPQRPPELDDALIGILFGTNGPVRATVSGASAPLFDYAAEVAAARKEITPLQKSIGADFIPASPAEGQPLKSLKVRGVRIAKRIDSQKLNLFDRSDAEYCLTLFAEFPGTVLEFTDENAIDAAIADDGTSLLRAPVRGSRIYFPRLSSDRTSAVFDVQLNPPGKGVRGLRLLSGHLRYKASDATNQVDLGFQELKPGTKGNRFGAEIRSIDDGPMSGSQQMQLRLNLAPKEVRFLSLIAGGRLQPLRQRSCYGGSSNTFIFTFESGQPFPPQGRLMLEIVGGTNTFEVPFKLENIDLLGDPVASAGQTASLPPPQTAEEKRR